MADDKKIVTETKEPTDSPATAKDRALEKEVAHEQSKQMAAEKVNAEAGNQAQAAAANEQDDKASTKKATKAVVDVNDKTRLEPTDGDRFVRLYNRYKGFEDQPSVHFEGHDWQLIDEKTPKGSQIVFEVVD